MDNTTDTPMITLTEKHIEQCRTDRGGFTGATLKHLTGTRKPCKGWPRKIIGTEVPEATLQKAFDARSLYTKKTLKIQKKEEQEPIEPFVAKYRKLQSKYSKLHHRVAELESEVGDLKDALEALYKEIYPE